MSWEPFLCHTQSYSHDCCWVTLRVIHAEDQILAETESSNTHNGNSGTDTHLHMVYRMTGVLGNDSALLRLYWAGDNG